MSSSSSIPASSYKSSSCELSELGTWCDNLTGCLDDAAVEGFTSCATSGAQFTCAV